MYQCHRDGERNLIPESSGTVYLLQATGLRWLLWEGLVSQGMKTGCWDCCHSEGLKTHLERGSGIQTLPPHRLSSSQAAVGGGHRVPRGSDSRGPPQPLAGYAPGHRSPATMRTSLCCLSPCATPDLHPGLSEPSGESCGQWECWGREEGRAGSLESGCATLEEE